MHSNPNCFCNHGSKKMKAHFTKDCFNKSVSKCISFYLLGQHPNLIIVTHKIPPHMFSISHRHGTSLQEKYMADIMYLTWDNLNTNNSFHL